MTFHGLTDLTNAFNNFINGVNVPTVYMHPDDVKDYINWCCENDQSINFDHPTFKGVEIEQTTTIEKGIAHVIRRDGLIAAIAIKFN